MDTGDHEVQQRGNRIFASIRRAIEDVAVGTEGAGDSSAVHADPEHRSFRPRFELRSLTSRGTSETELAANQPMERRPPTAHRQFSQNP